MLEHTQDISTANCNNSQEQIQRANSIVISLLKICANDSDLPPAVLVYIDDTPAAQVEGKIGQDAPCKRHPIPVFDPE
jgi:hypothetical protein